MAEGFDLCDVHIYFMVSILLEYFDIVQVRSYSLHYSCGDIVTFHVVYIW